MRGKLAGGEIQEVAGEARSHRGLWVTLSQELGSDYEQHGEYGGLVSRGTYEDLLRNLVPSRHWALNKCELFTLLCHQLAWHPKTSLATTPSTKPSYLVPSSFHPSPGPSLRPTDPNLPALSLRTGLGQAWWGPRLPDTGSLA